MISGLRGTALASAPGHVVVETQGGVLYEVLVPVSLHARIAEGRPLFLYTVLKIRDEDPVMFGFLDREQREVFLKLIGVSGVGGKIALSCLSAFTPGELALAIAGGDVAAISSVPGIGKKTAQRLILELSGKLVPPASTGEDTGRARLRTDLESGLVNLGYTLKVAREAAERTLRENPGVTGFEEAFRAAMRRLSR
ncbi:MAG TPA: Holliday junction branch migration protein RuvA [Candidatus Aminicenantes bacterium]|nr:Holliday junction branch migration protein RuvA [Candidatus Aminicenantes bacterium]